jgi:hypothetical protein
MNDIDRLEQRIKELEDKLADLQKPVVIHYHYNNVPYTPIITTDDPQPYRWYTTSTGSSV